MSETVAHARVFQAGEQEFLTGDNQRYLERVLRLRPGDPFVITDGAGREAAAILGKEGAFRRDPWREPGREPVLPITLYVALIKGDRFEWALEKAVELGVGTVVPVQADRCVVRDPSSGKGDRWQKVMTAAMLQCGGCRLPVLAGTMAMADLPTCGEHRRGFLLDAAGDRFEAREPRAALAGRVGLEPAESPSVAVGERQAAAQVAVEGCSAISSWSDLSEVSILSGPEGGFTADEVALARARGWRLWSLGPRRLRAETAPLVAAARLLGM